MKMVKNIGSSESTKRKRVLKDVFWLRTGLRVSISSIYLRVRIPTGPPDRDRGILGQSMCGCGP